MSIPVSKPNYGFHEFYYGLNALITGKLSGHSGSNILKFETSLSKRFARENAICVNSGTSALLLAARVLNIGPGDEVLVSSYTNMATIFPILQLGATPVPIDIEIDSWNMCPLDLRKCVTKKTKAIFVVHIFGLPAKMDEIMKVAHDYKLSVIEDCAEAHGATINNQMVGTFGDLACYSFYSNKLVSTGEGGAILTNSSEYAQRLRDLRNLSFGDFNKFIHKSDGYNFRMTNFQAGIGIAQLRKLNKTIKKKKKIARKYGKVFKNINHIQLPIEPAGYSNVYWMYKIVLETPELVSKVRNMLLNHRIETRPGFIPLSDQNNLIKLFNLTLRSTPIASKIGVTSLYLPSGPRISRLKLNKAAKLTSAFIINHYLHENNTNLANKK
jgi:perosamine synthetase